MATHRQQRLSLRNPLDWSILIYRKQEDSPWKSSGINQKWLWRSSGKLKCYAGKGNMTLRPFVQQSLFENPLISSRIGPSSYLMRSLVIMVLIFSISHGFVAQSHTEPGVHSDWAMCITNKVFQKHGWPAQVLPSRSLEIGLQQSFYSDRYMIQKINA